MAEEHNHSRNDRGHSDGPRSGGSRSGGSHSGYRGKGGYQGHGSSGSRAGGYRGGSRSGGFRHGSGGFHGHRDRQDGQGGDRRRDDRQGQYRHNDHDRHDDRRSGYGDRRQGGNRQGGYQGRRNDDDHRGGYDRRNGYDRRGDKDRRDFQKRDNRDDRGGYRSDDRGRDGYRGHSGGRGGYGSNRGGGFHDRRQGEDRGYQRRDDRRQDDRRRDDRNQGQDRRFDRHEDRGGFRRDDNRGYSGGNDRRNDRRGDRHGDNRGYGRRDDNRGHQRRDDNRGYGRRDDNRGYQRRDDRHDDHRSGGYGDRRQGRGDDRRRDNGFNRSGDRRDQGGYERRDSRGHDRRNDRGGNRGYDRRNDRGDNRRGFYQRDRHEGYDQARRNSDGTISYPSQNPYTDRRPGEPKMPKGLEWSMLSKDERERLRGLSKEHAENIGLHVLAAYALEESDPEGALAHAKWAAKQASRIDLARETLALVSYRQGDYKLALKEFRTAYRMNGYPDYLPFIADCERGLGNARKAIEEATSEEAQGLTGESKVEMFLVYAGALGDLGLWDKAIETVQALVKAKGLSGDYRMRAVQAEQNFLDQAGRSEEALELEPLLEKLEAQYADEEEDPDAPPKEILIDYDLEHLDDSMMEQLSIDPHEGDYLDQLDADRAARFVWGQDPVRPEVLPAQVGWIPSVIAGQHDEETGEESDESTDRDSVQMYEDLDDTQDPTAEGVSQDQASDALDEADQTRED